MIRVFLYEETRSFRAPSRFGTRAYTKHDCCRGSLLTSDTCAVILSFIDARKRERTDGTAALLNRFEHGMIRVAARPVLNTGAKMSAVAAMAGSKSTATYTISGLKKWSCIDKKLPGRFALLSCEEVRFD